MSKIVKLRAAKGGVRFKPAVTRGLRAATARPKTFDPATKTFEFVLASEAPCRTYRLDRN